MEENNLRVSICSFTKSKVLQQKTIIDGVEDWECLHGDSIEEDLVDVENFENL